MKIPGFFRKSLEHKVMKLEDPQAGLHFGFDDEVWVTSDKIEKDILMVIRSNLTPKLVVNGIVFVSDSNIQSRRVSN